MATTGPKRAQRQLDDSSSLLRQTRRFRRRSRPKARRVSLGATTISRDRIIRSASARLCFDMPEIMKKIHASPADEHAAHIRDERAAVDAELTRL